MKHTTAHAFIEEVAQRNPNQPEFLQAVAEVVDGKPGLHDTVELVRP